MTTNVYHAPMPVAERSPVDVLDPTSHTIIYPESDGKPMADNTKQFHQIVTIEGNLEILFADEDVFIAGDLPKHAPKSMQKCLKRPVYCKVALG